MPVQHFRRFLVASTEFYWMRHAPELVFVLDQSEKYGSRVEELLKRIDKRKRQN